ncbi:phycobilisome linker polypeptide [Anabaena sp. CCY 9402-a]|uniref:phycobilisome linker polypeptide n=1 Tax=Anabaena sp. CCY 9402-a TaxID=3103867 RepID=UPI0039C724F1
MAIALSLDTKCDRQQVKSKSTLHLTCYYFGCPSIHVDDKLLTASKIKVICMATTIIAPGDFSDYSSCRVTIEVTGGCHQQTMRLAKYTKTIPYSCLSQTIQGINRLGGKITCITLSPSPTQISKIELAQSLSTIAESDDLPSANQAEVRSSPQHQEQKNSADTSQVTEPTKVKQEEQPMPAVTPEGNTVFNSVEYTFTDEW